MAEVKIASDLLVGMQLQQGRGETLCCSLRAENTETGQDSRIPWLQNGPLNKYSHTSSVPQGPKLIRPIFLPADPHFTHTQNDRQMEKNSAPQLSENPFKQNSQKCRNLSEPFQDRKRN